MRYENIGTDFIDRDFLQFSSDEHEGNIALWTTDELIHITNNIRKKLGYTDLVGRNYKNEVYYNFYLLFDTKKQKLSIQAVCNYGEKDDEECYELPMTQEEKANIMWQFISMLATDIYNS